MFEKIAANVVICFQLSIFEISETVLFNRDLGTIAL